MGKKLLSIVLIAAIVVAGGISTYKLVAKNNDNPDLDEVMAAAGKEADSELTDEFTINLNGRAVDSYLAVLHLSRNIIEFREASLPEHNEERTRSAKDAGVHRTAISDAVEYIYTSTAEYLAATEQDKKDSLIMDLYDETRITILSNPVHADMVARGLVDIKIDGETTIGDLNPWLVEFIEKSDEFYAKDPDSHPAGIECWLKQEAEDKPIYVSPEYVEKAVGICSILDVFDRQVGKLRSTKNYNLPVRSIVVSNMTRTEEADYQESEPALILDYINKIGNRKVRIGFNLLDRRFEVFDLTTEVTRQQDRSQTTTTKDTDESTDVTPTPGPTPKPPTPTPPTPTPPTPTPPGPTPPNPTPPNGEQGKDPHYDPGNQGNAPQGSGGNQPDDGPGDYQPTKPDKPTSDSVHDSQYQPPSQQNETGGNGPTPSQTQQNYESTTGNTVDHVDNGTPPPADEIPVHQDSHDDGSNRPGQDAGDSNGEFSMPD